MQSLLIGNSCKASIVNVQIASQHNEILILNLTINEDDIIVHFGVI